MRFKIPGDATCILGHTRMTTQGSEKVNHNNHPFISKVKGHEFALAHNGVLYNDIELRMTERLPDTFIETDSFIDIASVICLF